MKYLYKVKKEDRPIGYILIAVIIYAFFYFVIVKLATNLFPEFQIAIMILIGAYFIIFVIPMFIFPSWSLTDKIMEIFYPITYREKWKYIFNKKHNILLNYSDIRTLSCNYIKVAPTFMYQEAYCLIFDIILADNSHLRIDAMLNNDTQNFLNAIEFLKTKNIEIKDDFKLLDCLKGEIRLYDYIKGLEDKEKC